jgi:hypothetical protein
MYEMQGPRPVSRHRPADFSASFAPLNHLPGPGTHPVARSRPDHRWLGSPRAGGSGFPLCQQARGCPQAGWRRVISSAWRRAFLWPKDRGFPQAKWLKFSLHRVAQSFLLRIQLGVSPSPHELKFSLCRWHRAFPWTRGPRGYPIPGGSGLLPGPEAPESAHCRWLRASPGTRGPRIRPLPVAPGFPRGQRPQSLPIAGGSEFPPCRWHRTSPCPKARSFPLPGGSGFPLCRLPSLVVREFLRLSRGPHKGFRPAISRFFVRPQAIHS